MCATFYLDRLEAERERMLAYLGIDYDKPVWTNPKPGKRENVVFPGYEALVVVMDEGKRRFAEFNWGFIPVWSKTRKVEFANFNARDDRIEESKVYAPAFKSKRCLVPAQAFYEWDKNSPRGAKVRYRFSPDDDELLTFAGIWSHWVSPDDEVKSFTILTVGPMADVEPLHDRSPLVLDRDGQRAWLDPKTQLPELRSLLKTSPRRLRAEPDAKPPADAKPADEVKDAPKPKTAPKKKTASKAKGKDLFD